MTYAADATGPFYHGTRADLSPGDLLAPGFASNYADRKLSWVYFSGTLDAAIWGCELARGEGRERIYLVEPTGAFEDDPNLTDKRFPGNPTRSYRTTEALRVVEEIVGWEPPPAAMVEHIRSRMGELAELGIEAMDD